MDWRELLATAAGIFVTSAFVWILLKKRKTEEKTDNTQTIFPDKRPSSGPDTSAEVKDELRQDDITSKDKSYVNPAYRDNDSHNPPPPGQVQSTRTSLEVDSNLKKRNISNVSEVFRPPSPDKKSLSDIMIEKYDRKSKKLRSEGSEYHDDDQIDDVKDDEDEKLKENDAILSSQTVVDGHPCDDDEESTEDKVEPLTSPRHIQTNKSTEWIDKLKFDLDDDEDADFSDETSEEEKSDENSLEEDVESGLDDDPESEGSVEEDVNDLTKGSLTRRKDITSQSSANRLLLEKPIVIDNGSYIVRCGWGGEFAPAACVRNVIGSWRAEASEAWKEALGSKFIGQTAIKRHATLALDYPIEDGKIKNWHSVQDVLQHVVRMELDADLTQHPVLITEPANVDRKQREKMAEVMIESIRTGGLCLKSQAAMCALSDNHSAGLVINSGYGVTEIVPVYYGYTLPYATTTLAIGGRHITEYLTRLAQRERGSTFTSVAEMEIINTIKEKHATVPCRNKEEKLTNSLTECELPDGRVMQFGNELSNCTEPLFNPGLMGCPSIGLPGLIKQSLDRLDPDIMTEASNRILLCGGNSNLSGLKSRLETDLISNLNGIVPRLKQTTSGDNSAWLGGSLLSEQSGFIDSCITEDLYFEHGAQIVHKLCL